MIFWTGWGVWVFFGTFAWMFIVFGVVIAMGGHEPDPAKASAYILRCVVLWMALSAASVFLLARHRERTPRTVTDPETGQTETIPHDDTFMFIRMKYWTHILAAFAVWAAIASFFPSAT